MKMSILKKYYLYLLVMCSLALFVMGCDLFEVYKDSAGVEHTKIGDITTTVGTITPIANVIPGVGTIIGLVSGVVSLFGGMITSILIAKKRGSTLDAVIKGVELAGNADTKEKIKEVAGALGYEPYLNKLVKANTGT